MTIAIKNYHIEKRSLEENFIGLRDPRLRSKGEMVELHGSPEVDDGGGGRGSLEPSSGGHRAGVGLCFEHLP